MKLPLFTVRDLFWLVLVCALGLGWCVDRWRWAKYVNRVGIQHNLHAMEAFRSARSEWEAEKHVLEERIKTLEAERD